MARVLVIDDEAHLRAVIVAVLEARGHEVREAETGEAGLDLFRDGQSDIVVLDLVLPDVSGLSLLGRIRSTDSQATIVVITAYGSVQSAVEAMRAGAYDYLPKPFDNHDLVLVIERAVEHRQLLTRVTQLQSDVSARKEFSGIVGRSPAIELVLRRLAKVAKSDATVLLTGETGTGKELAARSVHRASGRVKQSFVAVNCGAIPASLAEDELFGHMRGAFTDARSDRRGRFEQAHRGTLFLDEIGDLPSEVQVKLLRAIQDGEVCRIGSEEAIRIDVRFVVATNRELSQDVATGRFRGDLFWRLNVVQIEMPALRHRLDDLPLLVAHLLDRTNLECRTDVEGISPDVQDLFEHYSWPGNVRELANVLKHGVIMAEGQIIDVAALPEYLLNVKPTDSTGSSMATGTLEQALAETEERLVKATLERFKGNRTAAASALGIDRRTLYSKLRQYRETNDN